MQTITPAKKFELFQDHWHPRIIGEVNDHQVKLVKFQGPFIWHQHEEDEMFLVIRGSFVMEFRDHQEMLGEGDLIIVPGGIEHRPVADKEVWVMLFEPASIVNTGDVRNEKTRQDLEWI